MIVNLFAFRHTDPKQLRTAADPVGPANHAALAQLTSAGPETIAAGGAHGRLNGRSREVGTLLPYPMCLGETSRGEPRHPLCVATDAPLVPWEPDDPLPA